MAKVKKGDKIIVNYTNSLEDGTMLDKSFEKKPFEFTLGQRMVIPGFEKAVIGMNDGETKTIKIPPEDAYGRHDKNFVYIIDKSKVRLNIEPQIGMRMLARSHDGTVRNVTVIGINEKTVTVDDNHPLAGKALILKVTILKIL